MILVKEITITRWEGPIEDCDKDVKVASFDEADNILRTMAVTAPRNGGYDKVKFVVLYQDGQTYTGRYDLHFDDVFRADLRRHIRKFCKFSSGRASPTHIKPEHYAEFVKSLGDESRIYGEFLDRYEM